MRVSGEVDSGIVRLERESAGHAVSIELNIELVDLGNSLEELAFRGEMGRVAGNQSRDGSERTWTIHYIHEPFFMILCFPSSCC